MTTVTTVRAVAPDEIDQVAELTARVFGNDDDRQSIIDITKMAMQTCPFMPQEFCWVALVDGRVVAKWQLLDFKIRVANTPLRMGGIQAVVAEPDENHKGYPKLIAEGGLMAAAIAGFDVLLGFAQRAVYYRRMGGVPVAAEYELELDARQIPRPVDDPFHEWSEDELPQLIDLYNRGNAERSGTMIRGEAHWPWMVRKPPVIHICDDGYIGVRYQPDELEIREVAGVGPAFAEAALRKLSALARDHGLRKIRGAVPSDHPLVTAAIPYGAHSEARYTKKSGCFGMAMNPHDLLGKIGPELERRLLASLRHDTRVDLRVLCEGRETQLSLNANGAKRHDLAVGLSRSALLQLAFGYRSVESILVEEQSLAAESEPPIPFPSDESVEILDTLFPHGHPFMWQPDRY